MKESDDNKIQGGLLELLVVDDGVWQSRVCDFRFGWDRLGIRIVSQDRRSMRTCKVYVLSLNNLPIYQDQVWRSSWITSNLIKIGFSFLGSNNGPPS